MTSFDRHYQKNPLSLVFKLPNKEETHLRLHITISSEIYRVSQTKLEQRQMLEIN